MRGSAARISSFALERFLMTWCVLERRQARGVSRGFLRTATPRGRDHGRGPDQAADHEGAHSFGSALVAVHGTIVRVLICTLGDLLLDVIVLTRDAAGPDQEGTVETRVGAGGQSANVAAWASELGAEARFVGKRGSDGAAELAARELEGRGVELLGAVDDGRGGVVVSLVSPDGSRTMLSDRGVAPLLRAEELETRWFTGCDWLHLSGYSLLRRPIDEAAAKATGAVQAQSGRISVDLASASGIAEYGPERLRRRLELLRPELVFANEAELAAIGGEVPGTLVLKRGRDGFIVGGADYAAAPAEVVDTTGAGDALAAGYLVGGPELAATAAARCVGRLGAMPESRG
ncbi:MAG: carbohydrate kinase family protein [Gaiellaceae bacterium]